MLTRRHLVACLLAAAATPVAQALAAAPVFYRNPGCGCCLASIGGKQGSTRVSSPAQLPKHVPCIARWSH